ncbi:oxidoreductase [Asticcacaulis sp. BYS171W]|uniref:Oxidoreductase n=1 Tax=Asticcacaulis aquaticus TaxID=2984212 RepID=A0ABT5HWF7_9CAUL|nr:oxidoreductase [Asticcacaulis aquaticus]MDC7684263.1 oxidoreductase [Asticcacaulis aquaticus]
MTPVNTALVGFGPAGKILHTPLIKAAGLNLSTVVSSRPDDVHADLPGVKVCDFETLLADPAVELVVVATPNDLHAPQAIAALKAGKHVVVDKPFGTSISEAENVVATAKAANRLVTVFHNRRWDGDFLTVKHLVESGTLGEVSLLISRFDRFRPLLRNRWREDPAPGTGVWYDLGPHLGDQALTLFGQPDAVSADMAAQRDGSQVTDYFHVTLHYGTRRVRLQGGCLTPAPGPRYEVHGHLGSYVKYGLDAQEDHLRAGIAIGDERWGVNSDGVLTPVSGIDPQPPHAYPTERGRWTSFYEGVAAAVRGTAPLPVLPEEALNVMRLLDTARESAEQGRVIRFKKGLS